MTCTKFQWDGTREHLTASDNFSHKIEYNTQCGKYYSMSGTCEWTDYDEFECGSKLQTYQRNDILIDGDWNALIQANEGFKVGADFVIENLYSYGQCGYIFKRFGWKISQFDKNCNPLPDIFRWIGSTNGEAKRINLTIREAVINIEPPKKLIIIDSGNIYEYPIINSDSLVLIPFPCAGQNGNPNGCPPNTLDCGDGNCCDCDFIYNSLSKARYELSLLKIRDEFPIGEI